MELVTYYIENVLPHVVKQGSLFSYVRPEYRSIAERWRGFHESQASSIVCVGGRQIGKTHNLLLRAIRQDDSNTIIISNMPRYLLNGFLSMFDDSIQINYINNYLRNNHYWIAFRLFDRVFHFMHPRAIERGISFEPSVVVYYDEPEIYDDELSSIRSILAPFCKQEIAVGSIYKPGSTYFKKWYEEAEKKIRIYMRYRGFEELKNEK
jgi:hypothetical protein